MKRGIFVRCGSQNIIKKREVFAHYVDLRILSKRGILSDVDLGKLSKRGSIYYMWI